MHPAGGARAHVSTGVGMPNYPLEPVVRPRIWRSKDNKVLAGVVGGLAERFAIDATLARVLFVLITIFSAGFPGTVVYAVLWLITKPHSMRDEFPG